MGEATRLLVVADQHFGPQSRLHYGLLAAHAPLGESGVSEGVLRDAGVDAVPGLHDGISIVLAGLCTHFTPYRLCRVEVASLAPHRTPPWGVPASSAVTCYP
eukprot:5232563-Pleurochrysis_carterae.AAC.1